MRIANHRVQLVYGGGAVIVTAGSQGGAEPAVAMTHSIHVRVVDARAHCHRAEGAGARIIQQPTDFPYGERQYTAVDPGGHRWTFSQSISDVDPTSWGAQVGALGGSAES